MLPAFVYWLFRYRRTWQSTAVVSIANPLLFLLAIGAGLGTLVQGDVEGVPYLRFLAPGVLAAAAFQNAFIDAGFGVATARGRERVYQTAIATPLSPGEVMAGHLLFVGLRVFVGALAFVVVMACFGLFSSFGTALAVLLAATLTGIAPATVVAAWAVTVTDFPRLNTVFRFVVMPMYLFSGTFFSVEQLPDPLQSLMYALPLWHGADLCRSLALGTATLGTTTLHIAYLGALAVAGVLIGRVTFRKVLYV
ncbi:ABC transporter permease [Herbidospora mongoliensis]|uniref:ABC transporter permease n=1 Tax=Herbidospora mongoliensis TaxID=688067 RepID=UPI00082B2736|nr:ABC transporter permease [Herbidospora mongoliensis]